MKNYVTANRSRQGLIVVDLLKNRPGWWIFSRICAFLVIEFEKLGACSEIQQAVGLSNLNDD